MPNNFPSGPQSRGHRCAQRGPEMPLKMLCSIAILSVALLSDTAGAATSAKAQIDVRCTGKSGSQVAIRWGAPSYSSTPVMPLFTTSCSRVGQPMQTRSTSAVLTSPDSEFEIQTEGGIETAYFVNVTLDSNQPNKKNSIWIDHAGSPSVAYTGDGFTLTRSSGPNKYGEQNFRVRLLNSPSARVKIIAQSTGNQSNAQLALRWGHPDFHDNEYFSLWTVKAGPARQRDFVLGHDKSEFEIQTEGGEGTGYNLSIWIDTGKGMSKQPSIEIAHRRPSTQVGTGVTDMTFKPATANVYGEMNTKIRAAWIVPPTPPAATTGGLNLVYHLGRAPAGYPSYNATVRFLGSWTAGSGSIVSGARTTFVRDQTVVVSGGFDNSYSNAEFNLQPGAWSIQAFPVVGGQIGIVTSCVANVTAGKSPFVVMDAVTRSCL